jgi:hypothetical protein
MEECPTIKKKCFSKASGPHDAIEVVGVIELRAGLKDRRGPDADMMDGGSL